MRRINFAADRFSNTNLPGVQSIVRRVRGEGSLTPAQLVESCLDLVGPIAVGDGTREELVALAQQGGNLNWDTEAAAQTSEQRVGSMLALIVASREYQFC